MNTAQLNIFQRLVRHWDSVHPYNAAQVLKLRGRGETVQVQRCWHDALAITRLGPVQVSGRSFRYEAVNGDIYEHPVTLLGDDVCLEAYLSDQLNRPFESGELPVRAFLLHQGDAFFIGVVYHHWIADSVSIRLLLREWFVRLVDPVQARDIPVRLPSAGYWHFFGPQRSRWRLGEELLTFFRLGTRFRKVRKLETHGSSDYRMNFILQRADAGLIERLHPIAHAEGVTLNDLFMASMARVCDKYLPAKPIARRRDMAVGMIVDLRARAQSDMSDVFGLFLGFANVICRHKDLADWPTLVRAISAQARRQKETDTPQASIVWMCAALTAALFVPAEKTYKFYRKHMPLAGGISNINLNGTWAARYSVCETLRHDGDSSTVALNDDAALAPLPVLRELVGVRVHRATEVMESPANRREPSLPSSGLPAEGKQASLPGSTAAAAHEESRVLLEYIRVSPTGPMVPLVFTTTTLGRQFHFGLTYRRSLISDATARLIAREFLEQLQRVADAGMLDVPACDCGLPPTALPDTVAKISSS